MLVLMISILLLNGIPAEDTNITSPFGPDDYKVLGGLRKTLKGDDLYRAEVDYYQKKLKDTQDPNHRAAIIVSMNGDFCALGMFEKAKQDLYAITTQNDVDDLYQKYAREFLLGTYIRQISHSESEKEVLTLQKKANDCAEQFRSEYQKHSWNNDDLIKLEKQLLSLKDIYYDEKGTFAPFSKRMAEYNKSISRKRLGLDAVSTATQINK